MSKLKLENISKTDRSHYRKYSQMDTITQSLQSRISSMMELDQQLKIQIRQLQSGSLSARDLSTIQQSLLEFVTTLSKVSFNEITSQQIIRENEKMKQELSQIKGLNAKLSIQNSKFQKEHNLLIDKLKYFENEMANTTRKYIQEQKNNEDLTKRLKRSEERVRIILESNITLQKDQLKLTLLEALQENEYYKKEALQKQKDIEKLNGQNSQLVQKIQRLNSRFSSIGKQNIEQDFIDQDKMVITFTEIPKNFLFRHEFLTNDCKQYIQSTTEYLCEEFVQHTQTITPELRKIQLTWLFNHHTNIREFCQNHNTLIRKLVEINVLNTYEAVQEYVGTLQGYFKVQNCIVWLRDYWTGYYYTTSGGVTKKILCTKGCFRDCLEMKEAINKLNAHKHLMYQNDKGEDVYQDNTYLFPITTKTTLTAGLIEFQYPTQSNHYSDIQYFASILGEFVTQITERIQEQIAQEKLIKQNDIVVSEFLHLVKCRSQIEFYMQMKETQQKLMQMSTSDLIFIENEEKMFRITEKGITKIDKLTGITGIIVKSKAASFFQNIQREYQYNQIVDLYSICPVYMYPIVTNKKCIAVLQVTLTNRQIDKYRFKDPVKSLLQQSNSAKLFCDCIGTAYISIVDKLQIVI